MSEIKVGELIVGNADRDAIHVAVAPVIAGEDLKPGEHVGFEGNGTVVSYRQSSQHVGIIDPFLKDEVKKGEKCWLFVYPKDRSQSSASLGSSDVSSPDWKPFADLARSLRCDRKARKG